MSRQESFSREKFQEKIQHELNNLLRTDVRDPRTQFISITHVELNKDYSQAKVYWDTFDASTRGNSKKAIEGMVGVLRKKLSQNIKLRHTPELKFIYNSQFEDEMKITQLLAESSDEE